MFGAALSLGGRTAARAARNPFVGQVATGFVMEAVCDVTGADSTRHTGAPTLGGIVGGLIYQGGRRTLMPPPPRLTPVQRFTLQQRGVEPVEVRRIAALHLPSVEPLTATE